MTGSTPRSRDAIAADIEHQIVTGHLAGGDRLPSERRLAEQYGISRPLVREVLRTLVERGLIEVHPGRGAFVRRPSSLQVTRSLDVLYRRRQPTARHLSEARLMLECEAAALAAHRADLEDVTELRRRVEVLEASTTAVERVRNDLAFHLALAAAARNPVIETMFASIAPLTVELMVRSHGDPDVLQRSMHHHRATYEAIAARDPVAAREAMRAHLSVAQDTYGDDYDRVLDTMAVRALHLLGSSASLEEFLRVLIPAAAEQLPT